jgi:hypothetical protein
MAYLRNKVINAINEPEPLHREESVCKDVGPLRVYAGGAMQDTGHELPRTHHRGRSENSSTRTLAEYAFVADALGFLGWHHTLM